MDRSDRKKILRQKTAQQKCGSLVYVHDVMWYAVKEETFYPKAH